MSFYPLLGASLNCRLCFFPRDLRLRGPVSDSLSFAVTFMFFSLEYLPCCFLLEVWVASFLAHYSSHSLSHSCSSPQLAGFSFKRIAFPAIILFAEPSANKTIPLEIIYAIAVGIIAVLVIAIVVVLRKHKPNIPSKNS
jgi:hypothetical protein